MIERCELFESYLKNCELLRLKKLSRCWELPLQHNHGQHLFSLNHHCFSEDAQPPDHHHHSLRTIFIICIAHFTITEHHHIKYGIWRHFHHSHISSVVIVQQPPKPLRYQLCWLTYFGCLEDFFASLACLRWLHSFQQKQHFILIKKILLSVKSSTHAFMDQNFSFDA